MVLDPPALQLQGRHHLVLRSAELSRDDREALDLLEARKVAVDNVNRDLSRFEQIKRFAIVPREFSAAEDEVMPTLKLKRRGIEDHFAAEIERLFHWKWCALSDRKS